VCSTNDLPADMKKVNIPCNCEDMGMGNDRLKKSPYTYMTIECPKGCANEE